MGPLFRGHFLLSPGRWGSEPHETSEGPVGRRHPRSTPGTEDALGTGADRGKTTAGACWVPLTCFTDEQTEVWLAWGLRAEKLLMLELPRLLGPPASPTGGYFTSPDPRRKHRPSSRERPGPSALPCLWDLP